VITLATEWAELLARRPAFQAALAPLGPVFDAWQSWSIARLAPLTCTAEQARRTWSRGEPLLATAPPPIPADLVEPLLRPALDVLAGLENTADFIKAWDEDEIGPASMGDDLDHLRCREMTVAADEDMGLRPVAPQIGQETRQDHRILRAGRPGSRPEAGGHQGVGGPFKNEQG